MENTLRSCMKNRSFDIFMGSIKSPVSRRVYTYSLNEFMKFHNIKNYDSILKFNTKKIQKLLTDWVMALKEKDLKSQTILSKLHAIEGFLDMNMIIYHKKILHKLIPSNDYIPGGEIPFTNEEIQIMLDFTQKPRSKALIHFFASTGIRPAGIDDPILCLKHLEDMPNDCMAIKIYDGSRDNYWVFLTPEASKSLKHYLASRKLNGEELGDDSPIFTNTVKSNTKSQDHLSSKSARQIVFNILQKSGINRTKKGNRYDKATLYGFRKRFNTILKINNDVNSNIAEKLMAHKNGLDGNYLKPTKEQCFIEFLKAIETLTISNEYRDKLKIAKLQEEKTDVDKLQSQMHDMQIMQKSLADMIISLGKDKSQEILDKNFEVKKYVDLVDDSNAVLLRKSDGTKLRY